MKIESVLVLREETVDSVGNKFTEKCLKVLHGKEVPVVLDFHPDKPIGKALLRYVVRTGLVADIEFAKGESVNSLMGARYPAVQVKVFKQRKEDKISVMEEVDVLLVGVTASVNTDATIPPLYFTVDGRVWQDEEWS